jgi:hypothetical protein
MFVCDPRNAPLTGLEICTHAAWVLKSEQGSYTPKHL